MAGILQESSQLLVKLLECPIWCANCGHQCQHLFMFDSLELLKFPFSTPCNHSFCEECIFRHLDHKKTCPLCKQIVTKRLGILDWLCLSDLAGA